MTYKLGRWTYILHRDNIMTVVEEPLGLFDLVNRESARAEEKFGNQLDVPSLDQILLGRMPAPLHVSVERMAQEYEIPTESRAKQLTDHATKKGELTWAHIAVEELAEVIGCMDDEKAMRIELIQLMSVCQRWIHSIEHRDKSFPKQAW